MKRRTYKLLFALGLVLGIVIVGASAIQLQSSDTGAVSDGVTYQTPSNTTITLAGTTDVAMEDLFRGSDTLRLETTDGTIEFESQGQASATVYANNISGTYTRVSQISASNNKLGIIPADKPAVVVGKEIDRIGFAEMAIGDGTTDFIYKGSSGTSEVNVNGLPTNTAVIAVDADSGAVLDADTTDGSGGADFASLPNSEHTVLLQTPDAPTISDIDPQGDLDAEPTQIDAQISDREFSAGDTVTVNISVDGTQIDSQTISSNQEVTTSMPASGQTGGSHSITIDATDSYGNSVTETVTYRVPDTLFVRNETQYSDLVAVDGSVRFFQGDSTEGSKVFERSANNGKINLTGLPVNQDFVVEVNPTDSNYTERTIYLESLYEQENAYVLNTSITSTIESRFVLNDPTGRFDSSSVVKIQRPITINGELIYQTIAADRFGTEGVTATLQEQTRYQLRVSSENFEQTVGPYRADTSETVEVQPGATSIDLDSGPETWVANAVIDENNIEFAYDDPRDATTKLTVWIYERGNKSNSPVANQTFMDVGTASAIVQVPEDQADTEWVVEFVVNRDNEQFTTREVLSNRKNVTPPIDPAWQALMAIGALVLLAGAFSVLNAAIGAVIVSLFGGLLFFLGFLSGATSGIAVGIAIFVSVVGHMMSSTR